MAWYWWVLGYFLIGTTCSFLFGFFESNSYEEETVAIVAFFLWIVIIPCCALWFGNYLAKSYKEKQELKFKRETEAKNKHII